MDFNFFEKWLKEIYQKKNGEKISEASIRKYSGAIKTISSEMINNGIITKEISKMKIYELDNAIDKIFNYKEFVDKDTKGNRMYSCALKRYRCYRFFNENEYDDIQLDDYMNNDFSTESKVLVKNRIGQQKFKNALLEKYNKKCIITGLSISTTLIASHIKPWAVSNDYERLDPQNGLLLSATFDKLFDGGLITFNQEGKIIISKFIDEENLKILNINSNKIYNLKIDDKMKKYLKYHNEVIFVK